MVTVPVPVFADSAPSASMILYVNVSVAITLTPLVCSGGNALDLYHTITPSRPSSPT